MATIHTRSSDAGSETLDVRLYRSTTLLAQNEYVVYLGANNSYNDYSIVYEDIGAGSSPTYTIEACVSATAVDVSGDLVAIQGITSESTDGGSTLLTIVTDTTIVTESTGLSAGNNIVIASVQIDNAATGTTITAGSIKIKNTGGTTIGSNEFDMIFGTAANTDIQHITIIAEDTSAGANPSYTVTVNSPQLGNGEAKILVMQPPDYTFTNGGSVGIAASETEVVSRTTSYAANSKLVVFAAQQFDDTDTGTETFAAGANQLEEATVTKDDNAYLMTAWAASGSTGDGFRGDYVYGLSNNAASATWRTTATASATGINGEGKLLVIQVAAPTSREATDTPVISDSAIRTGSYIRSATDTPTITDSVTRIASYIRSATDTPTITDSGTRTGNYIRSATDTPAISDSAQAVRVRTATDTPTITDSATRTGSYIRTRTDEPAITDSGLPSHSKTDTPAITDSASRIASYIRSATDTPAISDSAQALQGQFFTDTPAISDSASRIASYIRTATDTPAIIDSATRVASYIRTATDTPTILDSAQVQTSRFATDTPAITDSAQATQGAFFPGGKYIWFVCAPSTNGTQGCVFALICPDGEYVKGIQDGQIICEPFP